MDLYDAVLARRSVRRYDNEPLDEPTLAQVRLLVSGVEPLVPENESQVIRRNAPPGTGLVRDLGAYGGTVDPPHYLVPCVLGRAHALEDAGYKVEQISVRLAAIALGCCFTGALTCEGKPWVRCNLPEAARIASLLVTGCQRCFWLAGPVGSPSGVSMRCDAPACLQMTTVRRR
jgi:hypothetical protein